MAGCKTANELAVLTGPFWSAARAQAALGASSSRTLRLRRADGTLLGVQMSDGVVAYPTWQFDHAPAGVTVSPGLVTLFEALKSHDGWAVAVLACTPTPELDEMTPVEWVRKGRPLSVLHALAIAVDREWAQGGVPDSRPPGP